MTHGRLARFTREAQVLASLNHPHIAQIYAVGGAEGRAEARPYLVMELVEGEDLSQRIARGAIPLGEALPVAVARDGRFLINQPVGDATATPITLMLNWRPPATP